ncbi:MAG: hypothetical protein WD000_08230 [Thermodesulfobacteriota bacterium]
MNDDQANELVGYLTRSKAIWTNPELLNLVEAAPSPSKAYTIVLKHTGSQKKAKAARWYACALRDYGDASPGTLVAVIQSPQGAEKLEKLLTSTSLQHGTGRSTEMSKFSREELIERLFVEQSDGDKKSYSLNDQLPLEFSDEQDAASFLAEAIRTWKHKGVFMDEVTDKASSSRATDPASIPEEELVVSYRMFRGDAAEPYFTPVVALLKKILPNFTQLGFVERCVICDCGCGHIEYEFPFHMLEFFVREGHEGLKQREIDKETEEKRRRDNLQNAALDELLGETIVSDELRRQLLNYASYSTIKVANPTVAALVDSRSEYGSTGGSGYWSQVRVFCGSQSDMREWQWRDRYSADKDKPWLSFNKIGEMKVSAEDGKVVVEVELVNNQHGNRTTSFTFNPPQPSAVRTLSVEKQVAFTALVKREEERIMEDLKRLWELKPRMVNPHPAPVLGSGDDGYTAYLRPSIKQRVFCPEIGVSAFVTEEQIDHRANDPQIRHELHVLTVGNDKVQHMAEDHGYDREGGSFLTILEVNEESIAINTKSGKKKIVLKNDK